MTALVLAVSLLASSAQAWKLGEVRHALDAPGNLVAGWPPEGGARIERADDKTDPRVTSPAFPATPGGYLASAWLRTGMAAQPDPNYSAVAEIMWTDAGGQALGTDRFAAVNGFTHVWLYRERPVQAPAGTVSGKVVFRFTWSSTGWAELRGVVPLRPSARSVARGL